MFIKRFKKKLIEILAILNGLLNASKSLLSISNSENISFAKVYHVNMPLSGIDLFRLSASFLRGFNS
jgi:hypothetical protein